MQIDRVEDRAPEIVLALGERGVADPDRKRPLITGQMPEDLLVQPALTADPYMICRSSPFSQTSAMNEKKSFAS
ncbi:hypothetical protein FDG2_0228 [Candidatus Protofrankia californiensis]|uniref:Uncharacterized protein n=1 Tax=Candidatus Protofrankia californiensis TaxID=1839754 RepID=A0A1C3NTA2_9ACTN|nr:hypothetical protein FDG2_0228 [Candidatus Protofrankia californiensis]